MMRGDAEGGGNFPYKLTDAEWRAKLSPESYNVLRKAGTEKTYSSPLLKEYRAGIFACAGCGQPLFLSKVKYDSKTGWPSFWDVLPKATLKPPISKSAPRAPKSSAAIAVGILATSLPMGQSPLASVIA